MGLYNLFRGYAFFKLVGIGVFSFGAGVILTIMVFVAREFAMLACSLSFLLLGLVLLFIARSIWRGEENRDSTAERYE